MTEQSERDYQITKRVRELSRAAIVRDHCEYVFGWPWQMECYAETDVVACSSSLITRESIARGIKAQYIPDMYEVVNPVVPRDTSSGLTAVFMGSGESLNMVTSPWASFIADAGYTLKVITDVDGRGEKWAADTWREFYRQGDVAIVPQSVQAYPGKSSVKVAQALAAGLPVLCSPLESYSEVVVNGVNGFVLPNDMGAAWKDALITLRDPVVRAAVAQGALLSSAAFSPDAISDRWLQVFNSALAIARERDGI
jgi:glycosyltransferase involved in cell wall biosynthesis